MPHLNQNMFFFFTKRQWGWKGKIKTMTGKSRVMINTLVSYYPQAFSVVEVKHIV